MSLVSTTPVKKKKNNSPKSLTLKEHEDNNNVANKLSDQMSARTFALWYKRLMDHNRVDIGSYIADNAVLEWFGRTVQTHKKVVDFLQHDTQCSSHDFTAIKSINKGTTGDEKARTLSSKEQVASPLPLSGSPYIKPGVARKRLGLRSSCKSAQGETCDKYSASLVSTSRKRMKTCRNDTVNIPGEVSQLNECMKVVSNSPNTLLCPEQGLGVDNQGDEFPCKLKGICVPVTLTNKDLVQGDCLPSTSGTDSRSKISHAHLLSQLPRKAVECHGYVELIRKKNSHSKSMDTMKWDRKCKLQISYTQNPDDIGNYVLWEIYYSDESKCRRNLMAAFEEVSANQK